MISKTLVGASLKNQDGNVIDGKMNIERLLVQPIARCLEASLMRSFSTRRVPLIPFALKKVLGPSAPPMTIRWSSVGRGFFHKQDCRRYLLHHPKRLKS